MNYLEAVDKVRAIEGNFEVDKIKFKSIPVWAWLRLYLFHEKVNSEIGVSSSSIKSVLKGLFAYNPLRCFKKHKIWSFTARERRKLVTGKEIARISEAIHIVEPSTLTIEKCGSKDHCKLKDINEKNIISEALPLLLVRIIEQVLKLKNIELDEGSEILDQIQKEYNYQFDYQRRLRRLYAQKIVTDFFLKILPSPQLVFIECPYSVSGYVWSFKNHGIKVIEMQHGVINNSHYAYNSPISNKKLNPDAICVFGEEEYTYFTKGNPKYSSCIFKSGLYILDYSNSMFHQDIFKKYRSKFKKIIVASGQKGYEDKLIRLVEYAAQNNKDFLFIYIPRTPIQHKFEQDNIILKQNVNIYEYLKWCDIHMTISSTTCLEAQYFNKPTIFYNIDNMSKRYYGNILNNENGCVYIEDEKDFENAIKIVDSTTCIYKELFYHNHTDNLRKIIQSTTKQ